MLLLTLFTGCLWGVRHSDDVPNQSFFYLSALFNVKIRLQEKQLFCLKVNCAFSQKKQTNKLKKQSCGQSSFSSINSSADDIPGSHCLKWQKQKKIFIV